MFVHNVPTYIYIYYLNILAISPDYIKFLYIVSFLGPIKFFSFKDDKIYRNVKGSTPYI